LAEAVVEVPFSCETFFRAAENGSLNLAAHKAFAKATNTAVFSSLAAIDSSASDRGVKPDNQSGPGALGVLNDKRLGNDQRPSDLCSSAYLEVEYITNPAVDKLLVSGPNAMSNRTKVMASVAKAIRNHMREMV
jgi:N-acetylmuramoyl-L-alanine amidase